MEARDTGKVLKKLARSAAVAGLDLSAAFPVAEYNRSVPEAYSLATFDREGPFGIVLGNSRAFWPKFLEAARESEALRESEQPLHDYVTDTIGRLVHALPVAHEVRWAHTSEPSPVAMQRASMIGGLAHTSPSYMSIHPEHGPWIGLRAVIVLNADWALGDPVRHPTPAPRAPNRASKPWILLWPHLRMLRPERRCRAAGSSGSQCATHVPRAGLPATRTNSASTTTGRTVTSS